MVNIEINELTNTVHIPYSCTGNEQFLEYHYSNTAFLIALILAVKNVTQWSGEAVCLEVRDKENKLTTIENW